MATKDIGARNVATIGSDEGLSDFPIALTEEEVNAKFDERRKSKEDRERLIATPLSSQKEIYRVSPVI